MAQKTGVFKTIIGGVIRNVAANLARCGIDVALVSHVGRDQTGDQVLARLQEFRVDVAHVSRSERQRTASYTALLNPQGTLAVAFSDVAPSDEMVFRPNASLFEAKMWLIDANLPPHFLMALAQACPTHIKLWAVGISLMQNRKFLSMSERIDLLIVNAQEFAWWEERKHQQGVMVTQGKQGAAFYDGAHRGYYGAMPSGVVNETGAGDAFCAGLAFGYLLPGNFIR